MLNAVFCFAFFMRRIRWRSFGDQGVPCVQASEGTWTQISPLGENVTDECQRGSPWRCECKNFAIGVRGQDPVQDDTKRFFLFLFFAVSQRQKRLSVAVDIFSNNRSPGKKVWFPATAKQSSYRRAVHAHHTLHSARFYRAGSKAKVARKNKSF